MAEEGKKSFVQGSQAFFEKNRDNYGASSSRVGDRHGHVKPVGTPFQGSPIKKYDDFKIYDSNNHFAPFETATNRIVRSTVQSVSNSARSEQTGSVNMMMSAARHMREASWTGTAIKDMPRQFASAKQTASSVGQSITNAGRFVTGHKTLPHYEKTPLSLRQMEKQLYPRKDDLRRHGSPFTSAEKAALQQKFGNNVNLSCSHVQRKITFDTISSKNTKSEICALQAKGASLTTEERKRLKSLMDQKKLADSDLRKTHGLQKAQESALQRNSKIDRASQRSTNKTIKKYGKKGDRLTTAERAKLDRMKDRADLFNKHNKAKKAAAARKDLAFALGGVLGKAMRESEEASARLLSSSSRILQNRHMRSVLKHSAKGVLLPARAAKKVVKKIDKKLGASEKVQKALRSKKEQTQKRLLHSRPYKELHGGLYNRAKSKISSVTPGKIKTRANKLSSNAKKLNEKRKSILKKFNKLKERIKNTKVVRAFSRVGKGISAFGKGFSFGKKLFIKLGIILSSFLLVVVLIGAATTAVGGIASSLMFWENDDDEDLEDNGDDRIDISSFVKTLNKEQSAINTTITNYQNNTEANGGDYKRVYVEFVGGNYNNNHKEILSMATVYFQQELEGKEKLVKNYIKELFNATNYISTSESEEYFCSGCKDRDYKCYDEYDEYATDKRKALHDASDHSGERYVGSSSSAQKGCVKGSYYSCMVRGAGSTYNPKGCYRHNNGELMTSPGKCNNYKQVEANPNRRPGEEAIYNYRCLGHCDGKHYDYSCPGHSEKVCYGHIDLYVSVTCMDLKNMFLNDPRVTAGTNLGDFAQGDLIGAFDITYYCAEKYPHICNAGPPYKTASGTVVTAGRTIAVDPDVIPLGTEVIINGHVYVAEDTGGAIKGNRIDIAVETHQEALNLGRDTFKVFYAEPKDADSAVIVGKDGDTLNRNTVDYESFASNAYIEDVLSFEAVMTAMHWAKENNHDNVIWELEDFTEWDIRHKEERFTNVELNTFKYITMSHEELIQLCVERGLDYTGSYGDPYSIGGLICNKLIPYDKEHPDLYVIDPLTETIDDIDLYFAGWNEDNQEWAKSIYDNLTAENYKGLEISTGGVGFDYGSVSLDGVVVQGSKIEVTYFSQHDPRWADLPVNVNIPQASNSNRMTTSGCGFATMSIVVSSLTSNTVAPPEMCARFGPSHYFGNGALHTLIANVSAAYNLPCAEIAKSNIQGVVDALNEGKLVVALVQRGGWGWTGSGYYRGNGHFLVICGVTEDGSFLLADPNRADISTTGTPVSMDYFVASGIGAFWAIGEASSSTE